MILTLVGFSCTQPMFRVLPLLPFRSVREDQAAGLEGEADRQEEEDDGEERQPQPVLQRVLRLHGRTE